MEGHANAAEMQERMAERRQESEAADAGYSSAEQARAATELAQMWEAHKKIDTELASRAKAMLKEMVSSGGDLDLAAVQGLLAEAQSRYEAADSAVVKHEGKMDGAPDETTFFKVEPREAGAEVGGLADWSKVLEEYPPEDESVFEEVAVEKSRAVSDILREMEKRPTQKQKDELKGALNAAISERALASDAARRTSSVLKGRVEGILQRIEWANAAIRDKSLDQGAAEDKRQMQEELPGVIQEYVSAVKAEREAIARRAKSAAKDDETSFFRVEPKARVDVVAQRETDAHEDAAKWESWRQHLLDAKILDETGMDVDVAAAQKLGLTAEQAQHIAKLQYERGRDVRGARVIGEIPKDNYGPSEERQRLEKQRASAVETRDGLVNKMRTAQAHERANVQRQLKDAEAKLAQIESTMRLVG